MLLGVLAAAPLRAQLTAGADLGGLFARRAAPRTPAESVGWQEQGALGAMVRVDRPFGWIAADAGVHAAGGRWRGDGGVSLAAQTPAWGGWRLSTSSWLRTGGGIAPLAALSRVGLDVAPRNALAATAGGAAARLSYRRGRGGAWLGADAVHAQGWRADADSAAPLRVGVGGWRQLGAVVVDVTLGARSGEREGWTLTTATERQFAGIRVDTLAGFRVDTVWRDVERRDSARVAQRQRWTEVGTRVAWARGRVALDGELTVRPPVFGLRTAAWGEMAGTVQLAERLAVVSSLGVLPQPVGPAIGMRRYLRLSARIAPPALWRAPRAPAVRPVATAFLLEPTTSGEQRLTLRIPNARVVELSGDFTGWRPVRLQQRSADEWSLTMPIPAGTHRANVRIDGERWVAPPGTTEVDDDFNGRVGLFVVP